MGIVAGSGRLRPVRILIMSNVIFVLADPQKTMVYTMRCYAGLPKIR
jgi:hypothetical protein